MPIQSNIKPKRGAEFILTDTGVHVWLQIIRPDGQYYCCYQQTRGITKDDFEVFDPADLTPAKKQGSSIQAKVKPITEKQKTDKQLMDEFFQLVGLKIPYNCMECGKPLYAFTKAAKRSVCAHILPKSTFESVKTNPDNVMYLGASFIGCACDCHTKYDSNVDARVKMKVYQLALEIFHTKLKPKLTDNELIKAYTYLKIEFQ